MEEIEKVRQAKIAATCQSTLFSTKGLLIESCESIFETKSFREIPVYEWFPFIESIFPTLKQMEISSDALHFSKVENPAPFLQGIYDFSFVKIQIEGEEFILWELFDYTTLYENFRNYQQHRNNLEIQRQKYILENKRFKSHQEFRHKTTQWRARKTSFNKNIVTPLNALDMAVNAIDVIPNDNQASVIDALDSISSILQNIIDELPEKEIDYTKRQSGREREFSLENLLYDCIPYISADNINIVEASVAEELPNRLYGNPLDLKRIIVGLAINATKHYHECSLFLNLYLEDLKQDKCVVGVQILATGESKDPNMVKTLLRLAIVKRIVELHQGKVIIESQPRLGAKTTCHIPFLLSY